MSLKQILNNLKLEADYIGLRHVSQRSIGFKVEKEEFKGSQREASQGVMVEVMRKGQVAYFATSDLSQSGVQKAAEMALALAEQAVSRQLYAFDQRQRPATQGNYSSTFEKGLESADPKKIIEVLIGLSKKMHTDAKVIHRFAGLMVTETETEIVTTYGGEMKQKLLRSVLYLHAVAADQNGSQQRTWGGTDDKQRGLEILDDPTLASTAERIGSEVVELLSAEDCPTGVMDLLLDPDQMRLQVHESIGHPLELDRILGDERNYAGWSFVQPKDFGSLQYGSKLMNVTFDPTVEAQNASYLFDDIGAKAEREFLIKEGVLLRGLGSLESQERLKVPGVACQRATSWNRPPIDRMANLNLEPGDSRLEDMIAAVESGILMYTNRSWSIDDYRLKFQFGCEYGKLIQDGRIVKTVKNPNYRGQTPVFWNSLKMVGDRSTWGVGGLVNCGKGEPNQVIFVGHATPYGLFSNIEVFGGGK